MIRVDPVILCIDCGGRAHLLSYEPHEGWSDGDVAAYRCEDCLDRWDIVLEDDDGVALDLDGLEPRHDDPARAADEPFDDRPVDLGVDRSTGTHHWP